MGDKLMTVPNVKTAMESDEVGVIDALRLAFAADPAKTNNSADIVVKGPVLHEREDNLGSDRLKPVG
jgi:hypothetical protein